MNIKQTMRNLVLGGLLAFGITLSLLPVTAKADCIAGQPCCGGVPTSVLSCDQKGGDKAAVKDTGLWALLVLAVNILTAGVGVLALAGIVYGAILYTSAGGSAEQVKKAMDIFRNVIIGVVAFAGMWALLNFLIPGGAFNSL